jgi:hypothetical protein
LAEVAGVDVFEDAGRNVGLDGDADAHQFCEIGREFE